MKQLIVFDFDSTIINTDSDQQLIKLIQKNDIKYETTWLQYMQQMVDLVLESKTIDEIKYEIQQLNLTKGFLELLQFIQKSNNFDVIMISGGNTLFINWVLEKYQIQSIFQEIFASKGEIINNKIILTPYFKDPIQCQEGCQSEICKQKVLLQFQKRYEKIIYVGDSYNDFCPIKILQQNDCAFARKDFKLEKLLLQNQVNCQWDSFVDGFTILDYLQKL